MSQIGRTRRKIKRPHPDLIPVEIPQKPKEKPIEVPNWPQPKEVPVEIPPSK